MYKLDWLEYPVILVGTSDIDKIFHLFDVAICSTEAAADFQFIFGAQRQLNSAMKFYG